jgi:hypothetical protein
MLVNTSVDCVSMGDGTTVVRAARRQMATPTSHY